jgi:frataxin-like iron-binding protein CyaY
MTKRTALFSLLLLCTAIGAAQAQSFSLLTGRNHPEIDWRTATTEHFEIVHPAHLDSIAARAAPIAETTYDTLSANLDVTFDERIEVYLTDQDAIVNGFAAPFDDGYTNIWVNTNAGGSRHQASRDMHWTCIEAIRRHRGKTVLPYSFFVLTVKF